MRSITGASLARALRGIAAAACLLAGVAAPVAAEPEHRLKLSHYAPPGHHQHAAFVSWAGELEARSNGRLVLDVYPAEQLGKVSQQYNLVRRGDVDIAFMMHGNPAGRFPLMELTHLPMLFESGEQASRVLMALVPEYLAAEHDGVRILYLFGHSPGHLHARERAVRTPEDLQGMRVRHPSSVIGETLRAWGASPAGLPPVQIAENLDKGVIDGVLLPYDGVLGFRLAPYVDYSIELASYVNTFAVVMNPDSYARLPADLQALVDATTGPAEAREVGARWDAMEPPGRAYMRENGVEIIELSPAERAAFAAVAAPQIEARLARTEAMGLPAREFFARLRELIERY